MLSDADRALGELAGVGRFLPNPHLLIRPFVRREAVLSSRIEGTVTRLDQLLLFEAQSDTADPDSDVGEVANYVTALEFGLSQLASGMPLCLRLLRAVHEKLMAGVRGAEMRPGQFRPCGVMIGRPGQTYDTARFVPPAHTALDPLLRDFESFLNEPGPLPVVVQLALAHYQFESIHPFMDGNGRLGRLLTTLMLCERRVLPQPLLYLSAYLERHSDEYRDHLLAVSQRGTWRDWIVFFARGVAEQARDAVHRAERLLDLWQEYRRRSQQAAHPAGVLQLIDELFAAPAVTVNGVARMLDVTFPTAQRYVGLLERDGVLRESTGQSRNRVYVARAVLGLLGDQDPTDPVSPLAPAD